MTPAPTSPPLFDPSEPLPSSMLAIEASAGTGKTFALSGLAARFLAEGRATASELLIVTFTRAATGELRSRVRSRLIDAAEHLRGVLIGTIDPDAIDDQILRVLSSAGGAGGSPQERLARLERAVSDFDAATITTIHGFAAQVLGALGVGSGVDAEVRLVDDTAERLDEACSDVLVAAAVSAEPAELPKWDRFRGHVRYALSHPDLVILPGSGDPSAEPSEVLHAQLVRQAVEAVRRRRREAATQSFDDLLVRLRDTLRHSDHEAPAVSALRSRYRVALIDEFQDTDPIQWEVFRTVFKGATPLVLVGDPKQAIYSFRGADVHTYLDAVAPLGDHGAAGDRRSLGTNWRSDDAVVASVAALFEGATFGDGIPFVPVDTPQRHRGLRLERSSGGVIPALSIRCAAAGDLLDRSDPSKDILADDARRAIFADLVTHTIDLLEHGRLPGGGPGDPFDRKRPVTPGDVAVLVRSRLDAEAVQQALLASGVPAVLARGASVFDSPAARHLVVLLEAMVRPSDQRRARSFAISWFGGRSAAWVAGAGDSELARLQELLLEWNGVLGSKGVVELFQTLVAGTGVVERLLAAPDGDRNVTDLAQLVELLHLGTGDGAANPSGLLAILKAAEARQAASSETDADADFAARRVECDAEAVQVMTVWVAKGLQFPIVMCPTLWTSPTIAGDYHDPLTGERTFDVRGLGEMSSLAEAEAIAEQQRLIYVALTRACHHSVLWWYRGKATKRSALARLLFARHSDGSLDHPSYRSGEVEIPTHGEAAGWLSERLRLRSGGNIEVSTHGRAPEPMPVWSGGNPSEGSAPLRAAELVRPPSSPLDRSRSRWSFSAIVSRDSTVGDPWDLTIDDDGADDEQRPPDAADSIDPVVTPALPPERADRHEGMDPKEPHGLHPLARLPAGATFGTLTHDVLERVDFTVADLSSEVARVVAEQQRWRSTSLRPVGDPRPPGDPGAEGEGARLLVDGLVRVIETPLGPQFARSDGTTRRLRDIPTEDRLDELGFELNLNGAGGHDPIDDRRIGALLLDHLHPRDPFRPWAERLAQGVFGIELAGHLTGSIDAVVRLRGALDAPASGDDRASGGRPNPRAERFVVIDYKTNRLHDLGAEPVQGDYGFTAMERSMMEHHYPLQALLYLVALHRYLRWRLSGYDPAAHLGGAAYLYVRGMTGAHVCTADSTPVASGGRPEGVCTWAPPSSAIVALSDLLDGRPLAAAGPRGASSPDPEAGAGSCGSTRPTPRAIAPGQQGELDFPAGVES